MGTRDAHEDLKNLYGGGLEDLLREQQREDNVASLPSADESEYPVMSIKRKKQAAILKDILRSGGYGDLAKQVSIRRSG